MPRRSPPGDASRLGVENLQYVADGDVGEHATLRGDDHCSAEQDAALGMQRDTEIVLAQLPQLLKSFWVAGADHVSCEFAFLATGEQPGQRGPHEVGADRDEQGACQQLQARGRVLAHALQPLGRAVSPVIAGGVGAAA